MKHALTFAIALGLVACAGPAREAAPPPVSASRAPGPPTSCDPPAPGEIAASDVTIVLDTSRSMREPSGLDVDGDGQIGTFRHSAYTDRDDSLLAAEIAAIRRLLGAAGDDVRFAIVSYSGRKQFPLEDSVSKRVDPRDAVLWSELTADVPTLSTSLSQLLDLGADGNTSFAPAMKLALRSLEPAGPDAPGARRRVLFLSDSPTPVRFAPGQRIDRIDKRMRTEAIRAIKAGVRFHTFGLGRAAEVEPPHMLSHIAGATGGTFRPVRDLSTLHCELLSVLRESPRSASAD